MIMARAVSHSLAPLFVWREQGEIDRIQEQRDLLIKRINRLRPHSHARIALQARLQQLTVEQLELTLKRRRRQ